MGTSSSRKLKRVILWTFFGGIALAGAAATILTVADMPPRSLGPYIAHRATGHNPLIEKIGFGTADALEYADRGAPQEFNMPALNIGMQRTTQAFASSPLERIVEVSTAAEAAAAIQQAVAGDTIVFRPGVYRFGGKRIDAAHPGEKSHPITVKAYQPGSVLIEMSTSEGFVVSAPYWKFENLVIRGTCNAHADCEHAFHIIGRAAHFVARNNEILDFNAHFKINRVGSDFPDDGLLEANTLRNTSVRQTSQPVTPIDIVAASAWTIRKNLIADFIKGEGDRISYGAFAKGAGKGNRFEQNVVICEQRLGRAPGQRVGLSFGGGGTGKEYCRDGRCITEHEQGVMEANLIASCSDDGIYINRSATSKISHNTLVDTGGIVIRYAESSADVRGNLVDGAIRTRDDGLLRAEDNIETSLPSLYLARHPVRDLYVGAPTLQFAWRNPPQQRTSDGTPPPDLCGTRRDNRPVYGAFDDFRGCLR